MFDMFLSAPLGERMGMLVILVFVVMAFSSGKGSKGGNN